MKKIFIICSCLLLMIVSKSYAQQTRTVDLQNKKFVNHIHPSSKQGWIEFRKDAPYTASEIFKQQPELLNMQADDEMRLWKTNTDKAGNNHYKFAQYYKGIRVEGIEHISHERNGRLHLINGDFVSGLNLDVSPAILAERSIEIVLEKYPAEKYLWENEKEESNFKYKKKDDNATLYPTPELLIIKKETKAEKLAENYVLAFRMYLFAEKPYMAIAIYVDAKTGEILREKSLDHYCNATDVETTFNGTQTMYTDYRTEECDYSYTDETAYFSINDCNIDAEIRSYYSAHYDAWNYGDDWLICSDDNDWLDAYSPLMVMSSLWAVSESFKYFDIEFGHESFDGSSGLIDVFSGKTYLDDDDMPYCSNANFTSILDNIYFGAGSDCDAGTSDDYNPLDIAGHEYTHGIIEYAHFDALDYSEESGALNESFADIFGEMVELWIEGGTPTWLHGEDKSTGFGRSFSNPNDRNNPDTYFGDHWADLEGDDNGGVHTNSGVQNHMFYLLSEGGTGVNDFGVEYHVEGIGYNTAKEIAWQAMMNYLNAADGYFTARNAWIQSAIDLYGSCSQEVISVGQAWQAVGVTFFTGYDVESVCGTYVLGTTIDATYGIENSTVDFYGTFIGDCSATITSAATVTFASGYYVELNPGFTATAGVTFVALIDECEVSKYDAGDLRQHGSSSNDFDEQVFMPSFKMYPSPADEFISLEFNMNEATEVTITVLDVSGKEIIHWIESELRAKGLQQLQFNTKELSNGMYLCLLKTGGKVYSNKFMVQH
ncbi:MAG: M4 family metallopeptidase [Chitinophagales bacterium]